MGDLAPNGDKIETSTTMFRVECLVLKYFEIEL